MRELCKVRVGMIIEKNLSNEERKKVEDFQKLHDLFFESYITKSVSESRTITNIKKGVIKLPPADDIKKMNLYVYNKRKLAYSKLIECGFRHDWYVELQRTTLISILLFNRKRPSEIALLLKLSYEHCFEKLS